MTVVAATSREGVSQPASVRLTCAGIASPPICSGHVDRRIGTSRGKPGRRL